MARPTINRRVALTLIRLLEAEAKTGVWNDDLDRLLAVCYEEADL